MSDGMGNIPAFAGNTEFSNIVDPFFLSGLMLDLLNGISTIECLVDFFEGGTACFDEKEVDRNKLKNQHGLEEEVELPASSQNSNRDNVLIDGQANSRAKILHEQAVGTNLEAENLNGVRNVEGNPGTCQQPSQDTSKNCGSVKKEQDIPSKVVKEVVEKNNGDDTLSKGDFMRLQVLGGQGDPDGKCAAHSTGSNQEQPTPAETIDHVTPKPSLKHVAHQNKSVEHVLVVRAGNAKVLKNVVQVVRGQTGARELRKDTAA